MLSSRSLGPLKKAFLAPAVAALLLAGCAGD